MHLQYEPSQLDPITLFFGTDGDDRIGPNGLKHNTLGLSGNDQIEAESGDDGVYGGSGNDRIGRGEGRDDIFGDKIDDPNIPVACGERYGSDSIFGEVGNVQFYCGIGTLNDSKAILSGSHKDFINCGRGLRMDKYNSDYDAASKCEHVQIG